MSDYHYPLARAVVLGICPSGETISPTIGDSVTSRRMDSLCPTWREHAISANLWWTKREFLTGKPSHIAQILRDTRCELIIALGREAARELGAEGPFNTWYRIDRGPNLPPLQVLRFPHPSGLNRHWNSAANREAGARSLSDAFMLRVIG
jgi:uracil-DNA glycosylase